jgi:hypothetical protein
MKVEVFRANVAESPHYLSEPSKRHLSEIAITQISIGTGAGMEE